MGNDSQDNNSLIPLTEKEQDHIKFFVLFIISVFFADITVQFLGRFIPGIIIGLSKIFTIYAPVLLFTIFTIGYGRLLIEFLPDFAVERVPGWPVLIGIVLIIAHPIIITISGSSFLIIWVLIDNIKSNSILYVLVYHALLLFAIYVISEIQVKSELKDSNLSKYFKYLGKEIFNLLIVIIAIVYIAESAFKDNFDPLDLTKPLRYLFVLLLAYATLPNDDTALPNDTETSSSDDKKAKNEN